jgi:hypothetical protein
LTNWFEVEFVLLKHLKLQPSELDAMEFYRVEYLLENWKEHTEKENKSRKEQESDTTDKYSPSAMQRSQSSMMKNYMGGNNNLGSMGGNMSMPKMPNMSMPKW